MGSCLSYFYRIIRAFTASDRSEPPIRLSSFQMASNAFADLPVEIIENIAQYLSPTDVLELRQTCNKLYNKTTALCSRLFFRAITTNLSRQDVQWLAGDFISNRQLASGVQKLRFEVIRDTVGLDHDYYWNRRGAGKHLVLPLQAFEAIRSLIEEGLINCRTFEIHVESEPDSPDDRLEPADILQLLLLVVAKSNVQFDTIEVSTPPDRHGQNGSISSKGTHLNHEKLPLETLDDSNVKNMLANLKQLSLNLVYPDELISSGWLPTVFASFKSLHSLSLDLDLSWGDLEPTERLLAKIQCPLLENLELRRFKATTDTLTRIMGPCGTTLRALCLTSITLVVPAPPLTKQTTEEGDEEAHERSWIRWIKALPKSLPNLNSIDLDLLNAIYADKSRAHLHFSDLPDLETILRQVTVEVQRDFEAIRQPRSRKFEYIVPNSDPQLRFEFTSHNWTRDDRFVLPGMKYEGPDMREALDFVGDWAREMSMF